MRLELLRSLAEVLSTLSFADRSLFKSPPPGVDLIIRPLPIIMIIITNHQHNHQHEKGIGGMLRMQFSYSQDKLDIST